MNYLKYAILLLGVSSVLPVLAEEREVMVCNKSAGIELAGTLALPDSGPHALLVMATGSGQQTRDEEIFGHKIFKDIADFLAKRGYATLRLDDRGAGDSGGVFANATTDDFAGDIASAIEAMRSDYPTVPCGVLGHSEGGSIAIKLASAGMCDFIVTLAAPAWKGDSIIMSQARAIANAQTGRWDKESLQRSLLDIAQSEMPAGLARPIFISTLAKDLGEAAKLPQVQQQLAASADLMLSDWYRQLLRYDPAEDIKNISVPWLALNGERDTQVLPGNLTTIATLNPKARLILLPGHNHLFQHCSTGLVNEYSTIAESISAETLEAIATWLDNEFGHDK